jgi:Domain of unknown function (DUF4190)/Septum formation
MTSPPGPPPGYQPYPQQGYPYGQYGPQYGQPPSPYPPKPSTNGFAIASLILGIIGGVLLSVIFGIIALNQTKGGRQAGRGMAIAGLVLSGLWTLGFIALMVLAIFLARWDSVRATDIKTGDCIKESPADGATVSRLSRVSCDEPHEGEVYAMIRVSGDTFPGQPAMRREYQPRCLSALESYAPDAAYDPSVDNFILYPSQETWDRGDRDVACIAITKDKPTGSIKK